MDGWDKFKETILPPKEAFYGKLNMSGVSNQDYEHARRVWNKLGINNLGGVSRPILTHGHYPVGKRLRIL